MKKRVGKTHGSRRRPAVKDLAAVKSREVKGGDGRLLHDLKIVKRADAN